MLAWPIRIVLVAAAALACTEYRTAAVGITPVEGPMRIVRDTGVVTASSATVWSFAWGLAKKGEVNLDCHGQGMKEVTVRDNFGFTLLNLLTLGIVAPKRVEAKCAAPSPAEGELRPTGGER